MYNLVLFITLRKAHRVIRCGSHNVIPILRYYLWNDEHKWITKSIFNRSCKWAWFSKNSKWALNPPSNRCAESFISVCLVWQLVKDGRQFCRSPVVHHPGFPCARSPAPRRYPQNLLSLPRVCVEWYRCRRFRAASWLEGKKNIENPSYLVCWVSALLSTFLVFFYRSPE